MLGLYLHIPFCDGKCPYCDFYSVRGTEDDKKRYAEKMSEYLAEWGEKLSHPPVDTVYFGGGTPSLLGAEGLSALLSAARKAFRVTAEAEITAECNPRSSSGEFFAQLKEGGFNRLSVGVQSFRDSELITLGRRHTAAEAESTLSEAKKAGFDNLSVDLMINLPRQTKESLSVSLEKVSSLSPRHVSVYMLKNEEGTPFASLPPMDEDEAAEQYRFVCEKLEEAGYHQYEISNFARMGWESRHNLKYWRDEEYLGIGPAAHGFIGGQRFFYPRDLAAFMAGEEPVPDGPGGSETEKIMLGLRLCEGVEATDELLSRAGPFLRGGLMSLSEGRLRFTREGFLVSNAVLAEIL